MYTRGGGRGKKEKKKGNKKQGKTAVEISEEFNLKSNNKIYLTNIEFPICDRDLIK